MSVVNTVQDAISSYPVTAAGRAAEIALLSAGLLTGVILGLRLGLEFELTLDPAEPVTADVAQFGISTFAAATAAGISALASYAPLRSLPAAGLAGGVGWAVYGALTLLAEFGPVVATGVAATVVGVASGLFRRGTGTRAHVIILSGIIPLLPGLTYRGFYQLATQNVVDGLVTMTLALAIGLALAAGVALGAFIAGPPPGRQAARREAERMTSPPCRNRDLGSDTPVHTLECRRTTAMTTDTTIHRDRDRAFLDEHAAAHAARDADRLFAAYSADAVCYTLAPPLQRVPTLHRHAGHRALVRHLRRPRAHPLPGTRSSPPPTTSRSCT